MAPKSYNPYRKCDFCGTPNLPTVRWPDGVGWKVRPGSSSRHFDRRAWTLHHHSNKMTCPNCRVKGMDAERKAIAEVVRHRAAMDAIRVVAEPETPYGIGTPTRRGKQSVIERGEERGLGGSELDYRSPQPASGGLRDGVCEPSAPYGERPKDKRYREIEKGKVIARLEDIAGVLRRHNALKDAPALAKYLDEIRENVANDNLMADIAKVREELSLRAVWISHQGRIICRVDGCWWKFNAGSVLELIAEAKKLYSGRVLSDALPKMGSARMRFDDAELLELAEHNARVAAKSQSPALRTYFNNLLEKVREAMGQGEQKQAA